MRLKEAMQAHRRYRGRATQVEAAKLAHVSQGTVSEWNLAGRGPELRTGIELATKLNVCVEWLYTERGPMRPLPPDDIYLRELMGIWDQLRPEDKVHLVGYARVSANSKASPFIDPSEEQPEQSSAAS